MPFFTVLGLFNLIQFSNARCNSTDNDKQGICYTASECRERGGNAKGTCAAGFGVCCLCKQTFFTLVYLVFLQLKLIHIKFFDNYNCVKLSFQLSTIVIVKKVAGMKSPISKTKTILNLERIQLYVYLVYLLLTTQFVKSGTFHVTL